MGWQEDTKHRSKILEFGTCYQKKIINGTSSNAFVILLISFYLMISLMKFERSREKNKRLNMEQTPVLKISIGLVR